MSAHASKTLQTNDSLDSTVTRGTATNDAPRAYINIDSDVTMVEAAPLPITTAETLTTTTPVTQWGVGTSELPRNPADKRNTQDRVFALTVQLRTAATQLQSENQKMKAEMYNIINEVVDITPQFLGDTLRPEWRATMRSDIGIQQLQSDYEELYNRHMTNPHEITPDLYTKMIERYSLLRNSYVSLVRDHAVLKDDLERLIRQLEKPTDPGSNPFVICIKNDETPIIGFDTVVEAFHNKRPTQVPQTSTQHPTPGEEPPQIHSQTPRPSKRRRVNGV